MKILLTGADGYIGSRLLPLLCEAGHHVIAFASQPSRLHICSHHKHQVEIIEGTLLVPEALKKIPKDIEAAYFLVHSISHYGTDFAKVDATAAHNFLASLKNSMVRQVIYLGGIFNEGAAASSALSRFSVENILRKGTIPVTILRTGLIIGPGSIMLELLRGIVEKNPVIILPKWANSLCQPIAVYDVLHYLLDVLGNEKCFGKAFEIGGQEVLTFKETVKRFARFRGLKRIVFSVPLMLSKASSYFLHLVSPVNLAATSVVVSNLKEDFICSNDEILTVLPKNRLNVDDSLRRSFAEFEDNALVSSWDVFLSQTSSEKPALQEFLEVPGYGCFRRVDKVNFAAKPEDILKRVWSLGGDTGWYFMTWTWRLRGAIDKFLGGSGFQPGRPSRLSLHAGDRLDFWRVILADETGMRLVLFAEIKLPGEEWLEFKIVNDEENWALIQTFTFRPKGLLGRMYWLVLAPFHRWVFRGMCRQIAHPE